MDQQLKLLAIDALIGFKGPTTDFEFGIVQQTTGDIGDAKTANRARLKALKRANWFVRQEGKQFNKWRASGKTVDEWGQSGGFNWDETIKTKKGEYNLRDIQATAVNKNMTIEELLRELNK